MHCACSTSGSTMRLTVRPAIDSPRCAPSRSDAIRVSSFTPLRNVAAGLPARSKVVIVERDRTEPPRTERYSISDASRIFPSTKA